MSWDSTQKSDNIDLSNQDYIAMSKPKVFISYSKRVYPGLISKLIETVKETLGEIKWQAVDPMVRPEIESIREKVEHDMLESDAIIVDATLQIPNVMFEIGFFRALKRPVVILINEGAYKHKELQSYFNVIGISDARRFSTDLGDAEFLTYPIDVDAVDEWAHFKNQLKIKLHGVRELLSRSMIGIHKQHRRLFVETLRYAEHNGCDHPLLDFILGWYNEITRSFEDYEKSSFRIDADYYESCLLALRDESADAFHAIADLSDPIEEFWNHMPDPVKTRAKERIFLVPWKMFFDNDSLDDLHRLLQAHSRHYTVRVGHIPFSVVSPENLFGRLGKYDSTGWNTLLISPDLVARYVIHNGRRFLLFSRDKAAYDKTLIRYRGIAENTIVFDQDWRPHQLRRAWLNAEQIGHWKDEWQTVEHRSADYFEKYDLHIRCWIPFYEKMISFCAGLAQSGIVERIQRARRPVKVLEIGFGTGALSDVLTRWIDILNAPFDSVRGAAVVDCYFGVDRAENRMRPLLEQRLSALATKYRFLDGTAWGAFPEIVEKNGPYDVICGSLVLHDIAAEDPQSALEEMFAVAKRMLCPDGIMIFADIFTSSNAAARESEFAFWRNHMYEVGLNEGAISLFLERNREMIDFVTVDAFCDIAKRNGFRARVKPVPGAPQKCPFRVAKVERAVDGN